MDNTPDNTRHLLWTVGTAGKRISAPGDDQETSTRRRGSGLLSIIAVFMPISVRDQTDGALRAETVEDLRLFPWEVPDCPLLSVLVFIILLI